MIREGLNCRPVTAALSQLDGQKNQKGAYLTSETGSAQTKTSESETQTDDTNNDSLAADFFFKLLCLKTMSKSHPLQTK